MVWMVAFDIGWSVWQQKNHISMCIEQSPYCSQCSGYQNRLVTFLADGLEMCIGKKCFGSSWSPLPVDCGAMWAPIFPAGLGSCGMGMNHVEAWCGSVLRRLQVPRLSPPLRRALSMAALTGACATGDDAAGHAPCHDHRAGDGRCPPLPAHAAAGQDPGGASTAPAAHSGDQHRVRGHSTSARPGTQQPLGSGGSEEAV